MAREDQQGQGMVRTPALLPAYDVCESGGKISLRIEMPGVDRESVEITVENNELLVVGRRGPREIDGRYLVRERRSGDYRRVFTLDDTVDSSSIRADVKEGVLVLEMGLKEAAKPRRIEIRSS